MFFQGFRTCHRLRECLIDPSTVFSTFRRDQLAKVHRHRWKERLKISKVAKFESDRMKTNKDMAPQSRKNAPTIQTSVKFRDFEELYLRSFLTYHSQLDKFANFKALFLAVSINFRSLVFVKS